MQDSRIIIEKSGDATLFIRKDASLPYEAVLDNPEMLKSAMADDSVKKIHFKALNRYKTTSLLDLMANRSEITRAEVDFIRLVLWRRNIEVPSITIHSSSKIEKMSNELDTLDATLETSLEAQTDTVDSQTEIAVEEPAKVKKAKISDTITFEKAKEMALEHGAEKIGKIGTIIRKGEKISGIITHVKAHKRGPSIHCTVKNPSGFVFHCSIWNYTLEVTENVEGTEIPLIPFTPKVKKAKVETTVETAAETTENAAPRNLVESVEESADDVDLMS